jgi:diguanylate cyclase
VTLDGDGVDASPHGWQGTFGTFVTHPCPADWREDVRPKERSPMPTRGVLRHLVDASRRARQRPPPSVEALLHRVTLRRLGYVALVAIPLHLAHLAFFVRAEAPTPDEQRWRGGNIAIHLVLLAYMLVLALAARRLREQTGGRLTYLTQWVTCAVVLLGGAAIAVVDQWITSNITPFLIVCVFVGLVFLMPPWQLLVAYLLGYSAFAVGLSSTQTDASVLLSDRVNGLTAVVIGWALSLILWHSESRNILQRQQIERQQHRLEEHNVELGRLAAEDELTGLPNRRELQRRMEAELARMRRYEHPSSLLLIDLDHFKQVNDRLGHPAGDALLQQVAALLDARLRASDDVGRWGGEEFLAVLPHTDESAALVVAEQLRQEIAGEVFEVEGEPLRITVSIGVAEVDSERPAPLDHAYHAVDEGLYVAKRERDAVATAGGRAHEAGSGR